MDSNDQQYVLMAAGAAAAYAQKKARDEARRALVISTALNQQNMSGQLDPKLQELLEAETRRVNQENFDWKLGWWFCGIAGGVLGLMGLLFFLFVILPTSCRSSYSYSSSSYSGSLHANAVVIPQIGTNVTWHDTNGHTVTGRVFERPNGWFTMNGVPVGRIGVKWRWSTGETADQYYSVDEFQNIILSN